MKILGNRIVEIASLKLPGDIKRRMKEPHVAELGKSLAEDGLVNTPLVRKADMQLIAGGDRIAGTLLNGGKSIEVRLAECTDAEVLRLREAENLWRRAESPAQRREALARYIKARGLEKDVKVAPEDSGQSPKTPKPGRPADPKVAARKEAAEKLGVSERTVRRHEKATDEPPATPSTGPVRTSCLFTYGMPVPPAVEKDAAALQALLDEVAKGLKAAARRLGDLKEMRIGQKARINVTEAAKNALNEVEMCRPTSLCPWCKAHVAYQTACRVCGGLGYATKDQLHHVPQELLLEGRDAMIMVAPNRFEGYPGAAEGLD